MNISFGISIGNGCAGTICALASEILYIINDILVPVLFAIAFIVFIYGVFKAYILSAGDEGEVKKGHQLVLWGVIGFAVMLSLWGLVNIAANTFGLTGYSVPMMPNAYGSTGSGIIIKL
jgi:Type IV secretion system pilin